jgi:PPK2 family polyphosphate:nucleotide phosphotransferase
MNPSIFIADPASFKSLTDFRTDHTEGISDKKEAKGLMNDYIKEMQDLQDKLYADNSFAILLIFQAMDAAGKDSTIKNVMSGINPQGCQVYNFKQPSVEELDHDFLWRTTKCLPERGRIGIFNRSYYEEVLIAKVHPEIVLKQGLPGIDTIGKTGKDFWHQRYRSINDFEQHMLANGTIVIKFFLNVSKKEQAERFLKRINKPEKNWKFALGDLEERKFWDDYQQAYETMIRETSTKNAPWYVIPADKKWYMQLAVAEIILERIRELNINYPELTEKQKAELEKAREILTTELA